MTKYPLSYWLTFGVLAIGILLRLLFLDADPHYYEWVGYITDEGRWIKHARSLALFDTLFQYPDDFRVHVFVAPLYQFINYLIFTLAGSSIWTSRIFTALCGSATLLLFWAALRRTVSPQALLVGTALLACQTDLLALSRMAVPEVVSICFQLLIYVTLIAKQSSPYRMLLAGLLLLLAVGMKATAVPLLGIFSIIILSVPRPASYTTVGTDRWRDLLLFWTGFALPILLPGLIGLAYHPLDTHWVRAHLFMIMEHLRLSNAYTMISFPFEHPWSPTFNAWALGLWLSALAWMAAGRDIDLLTRRYLVTSAIWFALYCLLMLTLEYFPTRYKVHILIPMAVNITVGISLFQRLGIRKVIASIAHGNGPFQFLRLIFLSFPTAGIVSLWLVSAVDLASMEPARLRLKLACLAISLAVTISVAHRVQRRQTAMAFYLVFPLAAGIAWLISSTVHVDAHRMSWLLIVPAAAAIAAAMLNIAGRHGTMDGGRLLTTYAIGYLGFSLIAIAPSYINPHYTIKHASRDLGILLSGHSSIGTFRGESLFSDNSLNYLSFGYKDLGVQMPEFFVVVFLPPRRKPDIEKDYRLVKHYELYVASEYYRQEPGAMGAAPRGEVVSVYRRKTPAANGESQ
ncbi:MAG: ArnT family glycosyltransferase [Candidatus Entotheonellia bacterium]